jgi:hypothetical protein
MVGTDVDHVWGGKPQWTAQEVRETGAWVPGQSGGSGNHATWLHNPAYSLLFGRPVSGTHIVAHREREREAHPQR